MNSSAWQERRACVGEPWQGSHRRACGREGLTFILWALGGASKDTGERDSLRFCLKSP